MSNVISLHAYRERQLAEEHAKALVVFECAAILARRGDPALIALVEEVFGSDFVDERVVESLGASSPRPSSPSMPATRC